MGDSNFVKYLDKNKTLGKFEKYLIGNCELDTKKETLGVGNDYLKLRQYKNAQKAFEAELIKMPGNANLYLLKSIAMLEGKTPFETYINVVKQIICDMESAILIEDKAIFHYFLSYIKYDFYNRKYLKITPSYLDEYRISIEKGIAKEDIIYLQKYLDNQIKF